MRLPERRRGIAVLMTAVMIIGVMSVIGLAVDVGMMYAIHTKLSAAVDAAALAGARAANLGDQAMKDTAQAYFDANIPQGYMLASTASADKIRVDIGDPTTSGSITSMTITGHATLPLLFLRFANPSTDIQVAATSQRRNLNLVLVLDASGSMNVGSPTACAQMRLAAQDFTDQFVDGRDKLGVIVFGGSWDATFPMSKTFKSGSPTINSKIASLVCNGNTGSAQAIWQAYQWLKNNVDAAGALNAMVFFTDGQPNGLTANWPIKTAAALIAAGGAGTVGTPAYANSSGGSSGVTNTSSSPWTLAYGISGCTGAVTVGGIPTITGFIARNGENQHGIRSAVAASTGVDGAVVSNSTGCAFASGTNDAHGLNGDNRVHEDVAYIPTTDAYGNSTSGYWDSASITGCAAASIIKIQGAVTAANPYGGKILLDHYSAGGTASNPCGLFDNNIDLASMNAAEDAALRARRDATYPVSIFSIGLGGAGDQTPPQFLEHVANTINSDVKASHSTEPIGKYIFVTGAGQLGAAFQEIASYVQRLSQ